MIMFSPAWFSCKGQTFGNEFGTLRRFELWGVGQFKSNLKLALRLFLCVSLTVNTASSSATSFLSDLDLSVLGGSGGGVEGSPHQQPSLPQCPDPQEDDEGTPFSFNSALNKEHHMTVKNSHASTPEKMLMKSIPPSSMMKHNPTKPAQGTYDWKWVVGMFVKLNQCNWSDFSWSLTEILI